MPGIARLHLEDAFEDSPQTRNLVGVFRKDADILKSFSSNLHHCCTRLLLAQREMTAATQGLSQHLKLYDQHRFPLEPECSIMSETLKQFTQYLDELSSAHQILATQLEDGVFPLQKFMQADLEEISTVGSMYDMSTNDLEESLGKYMKLSKKKDNEKNRQEFSADVQAMRKKFHQTSLHYFSSLNTLQYKRKSAILEPLISIIHAEKSFFELGRECTVRPEVDQFLSNITTSVHGVRVEMADEVNKTVELMDVIEENSVHLYPVEPSPDLPYRAPSSSLTQKGGYLFLRSKANILNTKWERGYFFIQCGNLMSQSKHQVAGSLLLDLNENGVIAEPLDCDDRRNVLHVICVGNKKSIIMQAENQRERDEWIATINNAAREGGYVKGAVAGAGVTTPTSTKPVQFNVPTTKDTGNNDVTTQDKTPTTPPTAPQESNFVFDAPIQFDIISPNDDERYVTAKGGPQRRINPFDQSTENIVTEQVTDNAAFSQTFVVRFLGSMEVKTDRGEKLILDTIQQVMAARAIHNVFKTSESHLVVSSSFIRLLDPSNNTIRIQFALEDISFWASHQENKRLLGFITRFKGSTEKDKAKYTCHVFECNTSAEEICHSITNATKMAYQALIETKAREAEAKKKAEKDLLLANIGLLDDIEDDEQQDTDQSQPSTEHKQSDLTQTTEKPIEQQETKSVRFAGDAEEYDTLPLSPDGKFVLLDDSQSEAAPKSLDLIQPMAEQQEEEPESEA